MVTPYESPKVNSPNTTIQRPRPIWVRIGLWGSRTRTWAISFMWLSLVFAGISGVLSAWDQRAVGGVVSFVLVTLWLWAAIR